MCLRPPTPKSLTEPVSFGFIDPSKRVSRAELDRLDKLWKEKQQRNGTYIQATTSGVNPTSRISPRGSFDSDMTRVDGRIYTQPTNRIELASIEPVQSARMWPFTRKPIQRQ